MQDDWLKTFERDVMIVRYHPVIRHFSYSTKEPGSDIIFIHFYTRSSIEGVSASISMCGFENSTKCSKISFDSDSF